MRITRSALLLTIAGVVLCSFAAPSQAIVVDTFNEQTQTVFNGSGVSAGSVSTVGGPRQLLAIDGATGNVNVTPGQWDNVGKRGDVRYGSGEAGLSPLNLDWSSFEQFEIDVQSSASVNGDFLFQAGLYSNTSSGFGNQNFLVAPGAQTVVIPFSTLDDIGATTAPTTTDLQDVDGFYIRVFSQGAASGNTDSFVITEVRVTGSAVPEPSSFALAALGLVGLGWFGVRRRHKA